MTPQRLPRAFRGNSFSLGTLALKETTERRKRERGRYSKGYFSHEREDSSVSFPFLLVFLSVPFPFRSPFVSRQKQRRTLQRTLHQNLPALLPLLYILRKLACFDSSRGPLSESSQHHLPHATLAETPVRTTPVPSVLLDFRRYVFDFRRRFLTSRRALQAFAQVRPTSSFSSSCCSCFSGIAWRR